MNVLNVFYTFNSGGVERLGETVEGTVVCTGPYAHRLNVARLAEGTYILRSLNRKGVSHRLGHFQVRRRL